MESGNLEGEKVAVILLGAGAPLAWGAPKTSDITRRFLENSRFQTKGHMNLAAYIQKVLGEFHERSFDEYHFEHIINALESLRDFYQGVISRNGPPKFVNSKPAWFKLDDVHKEIEYFRLAWRDGGSFDGMLFNNVEPIGNTGISVTRDNYKLLYISGALTEYLGSISAAISGYDNEESVTKESVLGLNNEFLGFYDMLKSKGYTLRFYTTNYDDFFPRILALHRNQIFKGFREDGFPDIQRILKDAKCDSHFNLHGSIHWRRELQPSESTNWTNSFRYVENLANLNPEYISTLTNPSERTAVYNIVAGFNKLQKTAVEPLKAFSARLSIDCVSADLVATIGYSFNDHHINRSLEYGVRENHAKYLHITKTDSPFDLEFINFREHVMNSKIRSDFKQEGKWWSSCKNGLANIYTDGFDPFLLNKEWRKIENWL